MYDWVVYKKGHPLNTLLASGEARSLVEAEDQVREDLMWNLGGGIRNSF
jgi:hypothetical protein